MKKLIMLFVIGLIASSAMCQGGDGSVLQKCFINSKTGDTIRSTYWQHVVGIVPEPLLNFRMSRVNSNYYIELRFHFGDRGKFSVAKGDSIWIKFESGYKVALYAMDSVVSVKGGAAIPGEVEGTVALGINATYPLTQQQVLGFAGNKIEKVRIFCSLGYNDYVWIVNKQSLPMNAARALSEKRTKFKVCEAESEPVFERNEQPATEKF